MTANTAPEHLHLLTETNTHRPSALLDVSDSLLMVVDVQEKMMPAMAESDALIQAVSVLMQASSTLDVPVVISEHYPKGLGRTLPLLLSNLTPENKVKTLEKTSFSCLNDSNIKNTLQESGKRTIIACGIESHICLLQSVMQLLEQGYRVAVVAEAVSSRKLESKHIALERMKQAGALIVTTEMVLFEWMVDAKHPQFKTIQALIK